MKTLETRRLILRPFRMRDLDAFYAYASSPNVGPNAGWSPHKNRGESIGVLRRFIREEEVWAIILKDGDRLIGSVGLHSDSKRSNHKVKMLGYVVSDKHWGHGYATEAAAEAIRYAFEEMRVEMVSVYHYDYNEASRRVIEKCGFTPEGKLRQAGIQSNGKTVDHMCYSMTRSEYVQLRNSADQNDVAT
jgi:putative acetyltransferase